MIDTFVEDFQTFSRNGGGGGKPWLPAVRRNALERFRTLGFPTPRLEDWHFTSTAAIAESDFRTLLAPRGDVQRDDIEPHLFGQDWPLAVFVNGRFSPELSRLDSVGAGIRVMPLARGWESAPELLEKHLSKVAKFEEQSFTALNTAFMYDGAVIHASADAVAPAPIHLLFVSDSNIAKSVSHPRNLIVADRHAKLTVIESYVGLGDAGYFTNGVTEVVLADGAQLEHYKVQRESLRSYHVGTMQVRQARDSRLVSFSYAVGAALSRTNIYTSLAGEGSSAILNGLYVVDGTQHVDHQTGIEHVAPNCTSHEIYKGILDGSSHGVFNGKVYVHPEAQKTDGKQSNNNLLLSERAKVDTKPQLEIFADDVKCTHGATVGRLDETALFYMKSRGIPAKSARALLTYAFAADVLETIELEPVREKLLAMMMERIVQPVEDAA